MGSSKEKNTPAHRIRYGRITGTIWLNQTDRGPMYNVTFTRSFQNERQQWQDTSSFGLSDLTVVAKVALDAHTWISAQKPEGNTGSQTRSGNETNRSSRPPRK